MPLSARSRRWRAALLAALVLAGCASEPPRPLLHAGGGRVALVAARFEPETNFNAYAQGKGAAAGRMGAAGAAGGAAIGASVLLLDPVTIVAAPILAPFTILGGALIGGLAGGVQGARYGLSDADAAAVRKAVDEAFAALKVQETIASKIAEAAAARGRPLERAEAASALAPRSAKEFPDYKALLGAPYAQVLEASMTSVRFVAKKGDPPRLAMEMKLRLRGVDAGGAVSREFEYKSRPEPVARWAENGGALIRETLETGYRELAADVGAWLISAPAPHSP